MRRSLISVAGANSRAGKAQISVAGDLLASLNPVNLQQKVNESQRGVGEKFAVLENGGVEGVNSAAGSSLRGVAFATNTQNTHPQTPSAREGALKVSPQTSEGALKVAPQTSEGAFAAQGLASGGLARHSEPCGSKAKNPRLKFTHTLPFVDSSLRATHSAQNDKWGAKSRNDEFGAVFAFGKFDEMAKANGAESVDLRLRESVLRTDATASRGALARNDKFGANGVNFKATFSQNRQGSLNSASNVLKNTQNRQDSLNNLNNPNSLNSLNLKTPPRSGFSAFGLSVAFKVKKALAVSVVAALCAVSASAVTDKKSVTSISSGTVTINGANNGQGYNVGNDPGFYRHNSTDRNGNIGWRGDAYGNPYISYAVQSYNNSASGAYYVSSAGQYNQAFRGVVTHNSAGTLYVIENVRNGYSNLNWTAFNITGGTVNITGNVNNIVFASYRYSMTDRNDGTYMNSGTDKLIAVSSGTLNVGQSANKATELRIGFGHYGSQQGGGVWVRKDYHPYTGLDGGYAGQGSYGSMQMANGKTGTIQSMHSWNQNVIEVTGANSAVNFNQNTYIVTTLDSTIDEPWNQVVNFQSGGTVYIRDRQTYYNYNWGDYYNNSSSRALYVGSNARANIASGVTVRTLGTVEFNNASTFFNYGTLKTEKSTWGNAGANVIFTNTAVYNNGTIDVGMDLTVNGNSKTWYNYGTVTVGRNASFNSVKFQSDSTNLTVKGNLSLTNTSVSRYFNSTNGTFTVTGNLSMSGSTFDGTGASLAVTGNSNFTGTNVFIVNGSKTINLGSGVSTANPLNVQVVQTQSENRAWAAGVAANGTAQNVGGKTLRVGTRSYNSTLLQTNNIVGAYNTSNIKLMKNSSTALATGSNLEYIVNTSTGAQINEYSIQRNFGYGANLTYTSAIVTDLLYDPNSGGGGGGGGGTVDPTPQPTDPEYIVPETTTISANERTEVAASANLQGMIDVHFLLSQFELMNKYQTNFNPDEFINNARVKRQTVKYRVGRNAKNAKKRIIKRVQRTLAPYDYSIWADAQYTQVSFTNGITYNGDAAGMSEYKGKKQVLETSSINGKVGLDLIGSRFDGYVRGYFGYNLINAENTTYGNQYDGSSYEVGAQLMSGLDLLGVEFQGYADIGYAYNAIKVETGTKEITASDIGTFDLDTNTHNIKAGLGVEKRFKIIGNADVGVGVDLDYVFSLGKEFKATAASTDDGSGRLDLGGEWKTPKQNHHYLITGAKAFAGYNIKRSNTYLYLQGTYGYQLLEQDEFINLDQVGGDNLKMKVKNAAYQNHLATAGVGLSQKLARNFNFHLQATKLFSNNYTNDSFQVRGQVSYKW